MKANLLKISALAIVVGLAAVACKKAETDVDAPVLTITASSTTFSNNAATATLSLSAASSKDVAVSLEATGSLAQAVTFTKDVTIAAGSVSLPVDVTVNPDGLAAGTYAVEIAIAKANGAEISSSAKSVTFNLTVEDDAPVEINMDAPASFTDGAAVLKLYSSAEPAAAVTVTLSVLASSTIPAANVTMETSVVIPAGSSDDVEVPVTVDESTLAAGNYVFDVEIASVSDNAVIGSKKSASIALTIKAPNYRSEWKGDLYQASYEQNGKKYGVITTSGFADEEYYDMFYAKASDVGDIDKLDFAALISANAASLKNAYEYYEGKYAYTDFLYNGNNYWLVDEVTEEGDYVVFFVGYETNGRPTMDYGYDTFTYSVVTYTEKTNWDVEYQPDTDTGDANYPVAIVVTACDDDYFALGVYQAGAIATYGVETILNDATSNIASYVGQGYSLDVLANYSIVGKAVPWVCGYKASLLGTTYEYVIVGLNAEGKPNGNYFAKTISIPAASTESLAPKKASSADATEYFGIRSFGERIRIR